MTMRTLGIVPARGGSKGVPRKNIRPLAGVPLLEYTARAAAEARLLSRVILSTDDQEIADVGRRSDLEVPFLRPAHLAQDDTPMMAVVQHAVSWLETNGHRFDAVCLLQPTSPLRRAADIDACIDLLAATDADAVMTILPVPHEHNPHWVYFRAADGALRLTTGERDPISRRQALPEAFHREGSVYVTRRDVVMERNSLYGKQLIGHLVDPERSVSIDTIEDWQRAECLLAQIKQERLSAKIGASQCVG
jgi:CMP-N,N'-diacetyllegionaminic acid synthase